MAKILIADDSPTEIKMFEKAFAEKGYEVITASDGDSTTRMFFEHKPDALVLDVIMPKKDGFQVCREIRKHGEYKDVPIVMISTRNQESDRFWGLKQGASEYLRKPFETDHLVATVESFMKK